MAYTFAELQQLAANAGFTGNAQNTAAAIALAESSGNPNAVVFNDGGKGFNSYGLMQINAVNDNAVPGGAAAATDPQTAMNDAFILSQGGTNFSPWSTYNSGAYQNFLPSGAQAVASSGDSGMTFSWPGSNTVSPATSGSGSATTSGSGATATSGSSAIGSGGLLNNIIQGFASVGTGGSIGYSAQPTTSIPTAVTSGFNALANQLGATTSGFMSSIENSLGRGFVMVLAIVVAAIGLWMLAGRPTPAEAVKAV